MEYKIEKAKDGRFGLWLLYKDKGWVLHQTYPTIAGAETTVKILYDQGFSSYKTPALPEIGGSK